jgi:predicted metalloprotease with PDZ domain
MCLDLAIRGQTMGKRSLDDVIRQLFEETKGDKPGYEEGRIRELCVKYGGEALGPIYDKCAKQAVELPMAELAKGVGLIWDGSSLKPDPMATEELRAIGSIWPLPTPRT